MYQGSQDYMVQYLLAEHERNVAAHRQEQAARSLRPADRRFPFSFGWLRQARQAVRHGRSAPVAGA